MRVLLFLVSCINLWHFAFGAIEEHRVTSLPGLQGGKTPSTHYSGYLPVGKLSGVNGQLHYWMIESTKNPSTDPIVLWLNGGPGSSSLIGLLTEMGQVVTNDNSMSQPIDGVPQVFINPYAWTTAANMIFLESPKGVGFSYCENAKNSASCVNTDESTAQDAYEFLVNFFAAYPEYKSNKFYITGESYAGIYIPMLVDQIDKDPLNAKLPFVGAAIGNGCWGNTVGTCDFSSPEASQISTQFMFGHGMYSQKLREEMLEACGDFKRWNARCIDKVEEANVQAGNYDIYNIYDECGNDQRRRGLKARKPLHQVREYISQKKLTVSTKDSFTKSGAYAQALNDYMCGAENAMDAWLSNPAVQAALHVIPQTVGMQYVKTATDLRPLYASLIEKHENHMLIYSGDTDGCVPYVGTEAWTRGLNFTVRSDWHQWLANPDMDHDSVKAGYAITYDKFQFVTIQGAGHMVPQYQPGFSLAMFNKFLNNEVF